MYHCKALESIFITVILIEWELNRNLNLMSGHELTIVMTIDLSEGRYKSRLLDFEFPEDILDNFDDLLNCLCYAATSSGCFGQVILIQLVHENLVALIHVPGCWWLLTWRYGEHLLIHFNYCSVTLLILQIFQSDRVGEDKI